MSYGFLLFNWGENKHFVHNLQTMWQNALVLKLFSKIPLYVKLDFNKIKLQVELDISNVEFYAYFATKIFLRIEFDFEDIKFYTEFDFVKIEYKKQEHFVI